MFDSEDHETWTQISVVEEKFSEVVIEPLVIFSL